MVHVNGSDSLAAIPATILKGTVAVMGFVSFSRSFFSFMASYEIRTSSTGVCSSRFCMGYAFLWSAIYGHDKVEIFSTICFGYRWSSAVSTIFAISACITERT